VLVTDGVRQHSAKYKSTNAKCIWSIRAATFFLTKKSRIFQGHCGTIKTFTKPAHVQLKTNNSYLLNIQNVILCAKYFEIYLNIVFQ